jgi:Bacterial lipid A biosynthesis acyltransferase
MTMNDLIGLPRTNQDNYFSSVFRGKCFSNIMYYFCERAIAEKVYRGLLAEYEKIYLAIMNYNHERYIVHTSISGDQIQHGLIIASCHLGTFPLVPVVISNYFHKRVNIIVLDSGSRYAQIIDDFKKRFDQYSDVRCLDLNSKTNLFTALKSLREGEIVFVYADANYAQANSTERYIECRFLGHTIKARPGVSLISRLSGVPIVYAFANSEEEKEVISISDFIGICKKGEDEEARRFTQQFYDELEKRIMGKPEKWFLWEVFHEVVNRKISCKTQGEFASGNKALEVDTNKLFYFEYKEKKYLHLVDRNSNLHINPSHVQILNDIVSRHAHVGESVESVMSSTYPSEDARIFLNYLMKYNVLIRN